jgi:uncharacterized membrane protein
MKRLHRLKRLHRRRLFNIFAFALLAFAIYLTMFRKEKSVNSLRQDPNTASTHVMAPGSYNH